MKDRVMDMRKISLNMNMSDFEKTAVMATLSTLSIVIRDRGRDFDAWMVEKKMAADAMDAASLIIGSTYERFINAQSHTRLAVQRMKELESQVNSLEKLLEKRDEELEILKS